LATAATGWVVPPMTAHVSQSVSLEYFSAAVMNSFHRRLACAEHLLLANAAE
jgi:hypothetical protein